MPKAKWGAGDNPLTAADVRPDPIEKVIRSHVGEPISVFISGMPKEIWGFINSADDDTLELVSGGGKQYTIRVSDISFVRVD